MGIFNSYVKLPEGTSLDILPANRAGPRSSPAGKSLVPLSRDDARLDPLGALALACAGIDIDS